MRTLYFLILCLCFPNAALAAESFYLEDLTWPEVRARMQAGTDTILIPTGGTEQNGPHIIIGKHNLIIKYTSGAIAKALGNALAAPVLAYVPEGRISPPEGHMLFPGTISVRDEDFAAVLEDTARSFKQQGFKHICFIGDHGGNQEMQSQVADKLTAEWKNDGVIVLQVSDYYANKQADGWAKKLHVENPAAHAGFMDAAEVMAIDPKGVRPALIKHYTEKDFPEKGAMGDPSEATVSYGKILLGFKIKAAVNQIRKTFPPKS